MASAHLLAACGGFLSARAPFRLATRCTFTQRRKDQDCQRTGARGAPEFDMSSRKRFFALCRRRRGEITGTEDTALGLLLSGCGGLCGGRGSWTLEDHRRRMRQRLSAVPSAMVSMSDWLLSLLAGMATGGHSGPLHRSTIRCCQSDSVAYDRFFLSVPIGKFPQDICFLSISDRK
jgi:hypothetical protein